MKTRMLATTGWILGALAFCSTMATATLDDMRQRVPKIVELKEAGVIGEQWDGMLGVIKADPQAKAIVDAENRDRREIYVERAKKSTPPVSVDDFMKVMGVERLNKEPAGRSIKKAPGADWSKK